jgi:hypothetical protein
MASSLATRHDRCTAYGPGHAGAAHVEWEAILFGAVIARQSTARKMANSITLGVHQTCPIDVKDRSSCVSLSMVHITQRALIATAICYEVFYLFDNRLAV